MFTLCHHMDIPVLKQTGSLAMPGQSVHVAIAPTVTDTVASAKLRFKPEERQCYFDDEIALKHLPPFKAR